MADENRILPGTELNIPDGALDDVVTEAARPQTAKRTNGFPKVDFTQLNKSLINFLHFNGNLGDYFDKYDKTRNCNVAAIKIKNLLSDSTVEQVVQSLGHSFFKIDGLTFNRGYLYGDLKLNTEIPLLSLKKGVASLLGDDIVDYFIREFGERIGITDETKPIDISKPEVQRYLPGLNKLLNLISSPYILRDPHLLLLTLDLEERTYATLFFNEAKKTDCDPFDRITEKVSQEQHSELPLFTYGLNSSDISKLTNNPQILPFTELLKIGKKYDIKELAQYADRLEKLCEYLRNIPSK